MSDAADSPKRHSFTQRLFKRTPATAASTTTSKSTLISMVDNTEDESYLSAINASTPHEAYLMAENKQLREENMAWLATVDAAQKEVELNKKKYKDVLTAKTELKSKYDELKGELERTKASKEEDKREREWQEAVYRLKMEIQGLKKERDDARTQLESTLENAQGEERVLEMELELSDTREELRMERIRCDGLEEELQQARSQLERTKRAENEALDRIALLGEQLAVERKERDVLRKKCSELETRIVELAANEDAKPMITLPPVLQSKPEPSVVDREASSKEVIRDLSSQVDMLTKELRNVEADRERLQKSLKEARTASDTATLYTQQLEAQIARQHRRRLSESIVAGSTTDADESKMTTASNDQPDWHIKIKLGKGLFANGGDETMLDSVSEHGIDDMEEEELRDLAKRLRYALDEARGRVQYMEEQLKKGEAERKMLVERQVALQRKLASSPSESPSVKGHRYQGSASSIPPRHRASASIGGRHTPASPSQRSGTPTSSVDGSTNAVDESPLAALEAAKARMERAKAEFQHSRRRSLFGDLVATSTPARPKDPHAQEREAIETLVRQLRDVQYELQRKNEIIDALTRDVDDDFEEEDVAEGVEGRERSSSMRSRRSDGGIVGSRSELYAARAECEQLKEELARLKRQRQDFEQDVKERDMELEILHGQVNSIADRSRSFMPGETDRRESDVANMTAATDFDPDRTHPIIKKTEELVADLRQEIKVLRIERDAQSEEVQEKMKACAVVAQREIALLEKYAEKVSSRLRVFGEEVPFDEATLVEEGISYSSVSDVFGLALTRRLKRHNAVLKASLKQALDAMEADGGTVEDAWLVSLKAYEDHQSANEAAEDDEIWRQVMEQYASIADRAEMDRLHRQVQELQEAIRSKDTELQRAELAMLRVERQSSRAEELVSEAEARALVAEQVSAAIREELVKKQRELDEASGLRRRSTARISASGSVLRDSDTSFTSASSQPAVSRSAYGQHGNVDTDELLQKHADALSGFEELARISSKLTSSRDVSDVRSNVSGAGPTGDAGSVLLLLDQLVNAFMSYGAELHDITKHCMEWVKRIHNSAQPPVTPTSVVSRVSTISKRSSLLGRSALIATQTLSISGSDVEDLSGCTKDLAKTLSEFMENSEKTVARLLRRVKLMDTDHTDTLSDAGMESDRRSRVSRLYSSTTSTTMPSANEANRLRIQLAEEQRKCKKLTEDVAMLQNILSAGGQTPRNASQLRQLEQENDSLARELDRLEHHVQGLNIELEESRRVHEEDVAKLHEKLDRTRTRNEHHQRLLAHEVKYLREKFRREAGFRTDLAFQKKYFLHVLAGVDGTEEQAIRMMASMMGNASGIFSPDGSTSVLMRTPLSRWRSVVLAIMAIFRMKNLSESWQTIRSIKYGAWDAAGRQPGGVLVTGTNRNASRPSSIVSETMYQRF